MLSNINDTSCRLSWRAFVVFVFHFHLILGTVKHPTDIKSVHTVSVNFMFLGSEDDIKSAMETSQSERWVGGYVMFGWWKEEKCPFVILYINKILD